MALSGEFTGTTANQYITSKIVWSATQDQANNKSTITAKLYYKKSPNSNASTSGTWNGTIVIGGYSNSYSGVKVTLYTNDSYVLVATFIKTIDHNPDGTKSVTIAATGQIPNSTLSSTKISRAVELDTIPRASSITCTTADIESAPIITIPSASSKFTHTVEYKFGKLTGTIATKTTATKISNWTIPADFYAQIPNEKIGKGTLTCTTYYGDEPMGDRKTCALSVTTNETKCKPTVSGTVVDTNDKTIAVTGNPEILVRYCSTALCTINATLNKNAGSMQLKTINNVVVTGNTLEIPNVATGVFDFYAKDSRGYFNSDKKEKTLVPYVMLTADVTAYRDDPTSGNATIKIEGNYYRGSFGAKGNTLTVKYRQGDGDYVSVSPTISVSPLFNHCIYSATVNLSGLDYTKAFTFEVVVSDAVNNITKTATIPKGIPVFDWGEEDFKFNVPVTINGVNILEKLAELEALVAAKG